jgi:hypothetical protein
MKGEGLRVQEDLATFFPQLFHTFSTMEKPALTIVLVSFPQKNGFPFHFSTNRDIILGELL